MEINADDIFDLTPTIDTLSSITSPDFGSTVIEESGTTYGVDGDTISDISKDIGIDPSDPSVPTLTKVVIDTSADNKATPDEILLYKYTITNPLPATKATVPIKNATLTDPLDDVDLSTTVPTSYNVSVNGGTSTPVSGDITSGLTLGDIAAGDTVVVEFDIASASVFDESAEINTESTLAGDNIEDILEDDTLAVSEPDIEKDLSIDPTDPTLAME